MKIDKSELDKHITGNYGEDQYPTKKTKYSRNDYGAHSIQKAKIINLSKFGGVNSIDIELEDGRIQYFLTPFCIKDGYSDKFHIGTTGMAQYNFSPRMGYWYFIPDKEEF